jgi:TRAP-type C4-dicarboxylate transport system permease large subunit
VPFFLLMVISLIILIIFPQISLWLPQQYVGR